MLLDFDVLIVTMCHLERKEDVSRFMRTCQTLHAAGIPILFSDGVYLDEKRQITSFYNFMSTGNGRRYQHLTTLTISLYEWQEHQTKRMIWRLLYRSRALEKLEISNPKFTDEYLRCGDAISMLPNLKELTMSWDDPSELQGMFAKMVSKLTKVRLVFYPADIWIDPIQGATEPRWREPVQEDLGPRWINPVELLEKFTSSLEQLDVAPAGFTVTDIPYINMKHLRIEWLGYPTLPPLVLAYPNLRTLITRCPHSDFSDVDVNEVRQYNQSFQQQTSWATLDYVSASANELHLLAICCKIRYLDLNCLETEEEAQMLTTVLPDCHPSILHIPFGDINMELFPTIVQSIHSDLLHLILSVNLEPYSSVQAVRVLVSLLLLTFHNLTVNLTYIRIVCWNPCTP